jgi:hypothetical protein
MCTVLLNHLFGIANRNQIKKDLKKMRIMNSRIDTYICVRFGALEEVFMSYRPHGAWRTMEVLEELA